MPPQRRKRSVSPTSTGRQQRQRTAGPEIEQAAAEESAHSAHSMGEHVQGAGGEAVAGAPQEAAADVPHSHGGTDNWWLDVGGMQRPETLPEYVQISSLAGNVMYNSTWTSYNVDIMDIPLWIMMNPMMTTSIRSKLDKKFQQQ